MLNFYLPIRPSFVRVWPYLRPCPESHRILLSDSRQTTKLNTGISDGGTTVAHQQAIAFSISEKHLREYPP